jgi:ribonuclease III
MGLEAPAHGTPLSVGEVSDPQPRLPRLRRTSSAIEELEHRLGYDFAEKLLLETALTHLSAVRTDRVRTLSNQRLEFLGDRVLGLVVSSMLFRAFPQEEEGDLSRRLADLVRRETCTAVADEWQLGPHIRLGGGEAQSGGRKKVAILADACEAVIGAVFLDGGFDAAAGVIERAWTPRMLSPRRPLRDAKTRLQEWAQGQGISAPLYRLVSRSGPDHAPEFVVAADVTGLEPATGEGSSKRIAEQNAAAAFLAREGIDDEG